MPRFLTIYTLLALMGFAVLGWESTMPAIDYFCLILAKISGNFIQFFDNTIVLKGAIIRHGDKGFALQVTSECSGLPATWLLIAAILAFKSDWKNKLIGIGLGIVILQTINIIRIISLVYMGYWIPNFFNTIHEYIWPALLHLSIILIFGLWLIIFIFRTKELHAS
jgi:exosortase H (IPTLxxWG-CTERM-specific)